MTVVDASPLDAQIRDAEKAVFAAYGVVGDSETIPVDTDLGRFDVRLQHFGPRHPGVPPVLLLHGVGSMQALAAPLLPFLADRHVIAIDWPGHGLSERCVLPAGVGLRRYAVSVVAGLLRELGLNQVDLVGHSLGAQFSLYAALDLRAQVGRLALLGAPGAAFVDTKPAAMMKILALPGVGGRLLGRSMSSEQFVTLNERGILGPGAFRDAPPQLAEVGALLASRPGNAESVASYFRALIRGNAVRSGLAISLEELGRIDQPTLLLWGDDDVFNTPTRAAASIVAIRDAHHLRLPHAGHAPWLTHPDAAGSALADHLRA